MAGWLRTQILAKAGSEQGQAALFATISLAMVVVALVGIAANIGVIVAQRRYAQTAADAAALAAADFVAGVQVGGNGCDSGGTYVTCAQGYAQQNGFTDGVGGVSVNAYSPPDPSHCPVGPTHQFPSYVQVCITEQVSPLLFGGIANQTVSISAHAVATAGGGSQCVFCVLDPSASGGLSVSGCGNTDVNFQVSGAPIFVNSSSTSAMSISGSHCHLTDTNNAIEGVGTGGTCSSGTGYNPPPTCGATQVTDPLASVPVPSSSVPSPVPSWCAGTTALTCSLVGGSQTLSSGVYANICVSSGTLTLNPGVYVLTGGGPNGCGSQFPGLSVSGGGKIINNTTGGDGSGGVMFYFTCPSYPSACSSNWATFNGSGNGTAMTVLTAPTSGTYKGLLMFFDRSDTNTSAFITSGGADLNLSGTIYAKSAGANISGNSSSVMTLDSAFIVDKLAIGGNGTMIDSFDPTKNYSFNIGSITGSLSE